MLIYIFRHGETEYNRESRYQGRGSDVPLSAGGRARLRRAELSPETVYTSPLVRAAETAAILFPQARQAAVPDLAEMDFGTFEGRNYMEMEQDPDYRAWVDGGCLGRCPGGEDKAGFCERTCAAFAGLVDAALARAEKSLVIVAHGGTFMAVMERFAYPGRDYFDWRLSPGCGAVLDSALWRERRKLSQLGTIDCRKEGSP